MKTVPNKPPVKLYAPDVYYALDPVEKDLICNGCGARNAKIDFVPDTIWGLHIGEACNIHDYMYHVGVTIMDKIHADEVFMNNMIRIIDSKPQSLWLKWWRYFRAKKYYMICKYFGGPAFWEGKGD